MPQRQIHENVVRQFFYFIENIRWKFARAGALIAFRREKEAKKKQLKLNEIIVKG